MSTDADIIDRLEKIHQLLQDEAAHVGEMLDTLRAELEASLWISPEGRLRSAGEVLDKLLAETEEQ